MDAGTVVFGAVAVVGIVAIASMSIAFGRHLQIRGGPRGFELSSDDADDRKHQEITDENTRERQRSTPRSSRLPSVGSKPKSR